MSTVVYGAARERGAKGLELESSGEQQLWQWWPEGQSSPEDWQKFVPSNRMVVEAVISSRGLRRRPASLEEKYATKEEPASSLNSGYFTAMNKRMEYTEQEFGTSQGITVSKDTMAHNGPIFQEPGSEQCWEFHLSSLSFMNAGMSHLACRQICFPFRGKGSLHVYFPIIGDPLKGFWGKC